MPHTKLGIKEAADYLHVSEEEVGRLSRQGEIQTVYVRNQPMFGKRELHDWLSQKLLGHKSDQAAQMHKAAPTLQKQPPDRDRPFLSQYLHPSTVDPDLFAKTRSRLLRELVSLAVKSNHISDEVEYHKLLEEREELCPTGLVGGVAIPHSRIHDEYLIMESFLVIARVPAGVPFGAPDGKLTDLFITPCAHDDRIHLCMLARIALLLNKTGLADFLRACDTADEIIDTMQTVETEFMETQIRK
jgi:PTS system nitrogen regulatory IIA component